MLSRDCAIRFIITINALKEGWDCPFAYILASLANKNSQTDVEQIVGRILRQPYTANNADKILNASYVFSCSEDFQHTVDSVVNGLNGIGFDKQDCRAADFTADTEKIIDDYEQEQKNRGETSSSGGKELKTFSVNEKFQADIEALKIPQFFQKVLRDKQAENNLFESGEYSAELLSAKNLLDGFKLSEQEIDISFDFNIAEVDVRGGDMFKSVYLAQDDLTKYQEYLDVKSPAERIRIFVNTIFEDLRRWRGKKYYFAQDLKDYIWRVVNAMTDEERAGINIKTLPAYIAQLKNTIERLETIYRKKHFGELISTGKIFCKPHYTLKKSVSLGSPNDTIDKALYAAGGDMNDFEQKLIGKIAGLENVHWWHRNIERRGFNLNGWLNHYPDFIVKTESGKIILVEAKGSHLDGDDSKDKLSLGRDWQNLSGENYNYFMVFDSEPLKDRGAYTLNSFLKTLADL